MLNKKVKSHLTTVNYKAAPSNTKLFLSKVLGMILLVISLSIFIQGVPLMFVFIGAYLGVPADAKVSNMDTIVWLLTSVTMMFLVLYVFIRWANFLWHWFITNSRSLALFKKKEKHAE